ncbi:MAG: sugar transferase [Verrucomicrobiota bacterium]|nr:sugar transferase [Verrucomicrobiota bacterium]
MRSSASDSHLTPAWKRALDLTVVIVTLPLWAPAMVVLALWIKLVSPGPVIYRQERVGRDGRSFMLFKFRSMRVNAEASSHISHVIELIRSNAPMIKLDHHGDSRLIPLGRAIRACGLDELPQIINILRDEMSLVGPRPCTPYEFAHYLPSQLGRVRVAPGLTGYWQVSGKNRTTFSEMIEMDLFYTRNLSLRLDLQILGRTLPVILGESLRKSARPGVANDRSQRVVRRSRAVVSSTGA